jgi:hypothetical protein
VRFQYHKILADWGSPVGGDWRFLYHKFLAENLVIFASITTFFAVDNFSEIRFCRSENFELGL